LVTEAIKGELLIQVPPVEGERVVLVPSQILLEPKIDTEGFKLTCTGAEGSETQLVDPCVNVKVAEPDATPVTVPSLVTLAMPGFELTHVPPVEGLSVVVVPLQIAVPPVTLATGSALTVIKPVEFETQLVELRVKIKVAVPGAIPVTTPALVTVAMLLLLDTQVPPFVGDRVVERPRQTEVAPVILTIGFSFTITLLVAFEMQPLEFCVNVKVAMPFDKPVTNPLLSTLATTGLLEVHTPPVEGVNVVVVPMHKLLLPVIEAVGLVDTVTTAEGLLIQPVDVDVNVKVAEPTETPVITPALVMLAIDALLLTQVPPVPGVIPMEVPIQTVLRPVSVAMGLAFTVRVGVGILVQPVAELVKIKLVVPTSTPVTTPPLVTVATAGLFVLHVPPDVGVNVVVVPGQIEEVPDMLTIGLATTVMTEVAALRQPEIVFVK